MPLFDGVLDTCVAVFSMCFFIGGDAFRLWPTPRGMTSIYAGSHQTVCPLVSNLARGRHPLISRVTINPTDLIAVINCALPYMQRKANVSLQNGPCGPLETEHQVDTPRRENAAQKQRPRATYKLLSSTNTSNSPPTPTCLPTRTQMATPRRRAFNQGSTSPAEDLRPSRPLRRAATTRRQGAATKGGQSERGELLEGLAAGGRYQFQG